MSRQINHKGQTTMLKERLIVPIDWKKPGESASGYLLGITHNKYRDGSSGLTYLLKRTDGARVVFKGVTMINLALGSEDRGKFIQVTYRGEDDSKEVREGMNRRKLFTVEVDDERTLEPGPQLGNGDPGITDEDIPF